MKLAARAFAILLASIFLSIPAAHSQQMKCVYPLNLCRDIAMCLKTETPSSYTRKAIEAGRNGNENTKGVQGALILADTAVCMDKIGKASQFTRDTEGCFNDVIYAMAVKALDSSCSGVAPGPHWFLFAGAWPPGQAQKKIDDRTDLLIRSNITDYTEIKTDNYYGLTPGLRAIVIGDPMTREQALSRLDEVKRVVPDAFIKQAE